MLRLPLPGTGSAAITTGKDTSVTDSARLFDLQKIDSNWEKIRRRLLQLQKLLAEPEELKAARSQVQQTDGELSAWHARQKSVELEAQTLAERVSATDKKLMGGTVRDPKELQALQASAEALRRQRAGKEEEGVEALLQVEEFSRIKQEQSAALSSIEKGWAHRHDDLIQEEAKLKRLAMQLKAQRAKLVEALPPADYTMYEELRKRKAGVAVVAIENGLCTACNVRIPTGVVSATKSRSDTVYCPSCGRILITS